MNNYTNEQLYEYGMRDIPGYEGLYAITSCGRVWSYKRKIFLKPCKTKNGYLQVTLSKNGDREQIYVHRVVIETYEPCENMKDLQVNHKSEIKTNNCLNNLEWMTAKENCNYGTRNERAAATLKNNPKISKAVRCLDDKKLYPSAVEIERQTGIKHQNISACCHGKQKSAGGLHWMFEEDYQNMLVAELLEIAFCGEENEPEETDGSELVSICGIPLNDYLAMNEAI